LQALRDSPRKAWDQVVGGKSRPCKLRSAAMKPYGRFSRCERRHASSETRAEQAG
jgi:hypothetical protein